MAAKRVLILVVLLGQSVHASDPTWGGSRPEVPVQQVTPTLKPAPSPQKPFVTKKRKPKKAEAIASPPSAVVKPQPTPEIVRLPTEKDLAPDKPAPETLINSKSLDRLYEKNDTVVNAKFIEEKDFVFVNAAIIRAPLNFSRQKVVDHTLYKQMSPAITKFEYDPKTQEIEIEGEAQGLRMHSWVKVTQHYWDEIEYYIIRGDMLHTKTMLYLWDKKGKTLIISKGLFPNGMSRFSWAVAKIFPTVSEFVIDYATGKFRKYIEDEYNKQKEAGQNLK